MERKFFNLFLLIILSTGLMAQNDEEIPPIDSMASIVTVDSIAIDSVIPLPEEKSVLDSEVEYDAVDSIYFDLNKNEVQLYGEAIVTYGDITLTAHKISYNFDTYSVVAEGGVDTAGNPLGKPSFQQKKEQFDANKITYNFDSEKGYIEEVRTEVANAYVQAKVSKKQPNNQVHIKGGYFTTCDKDKPHFGFKTTKMIVIPDDKVVTGPGYMVFFDKIPFPIALPFALIPDQNKKASGIIIPSYGDAVSTNQGFYLKDGGYYWAVNDYFHTAIKGSIYANGSWGLSSESAYKVKYKFNGNFKITYNDFLIDLQGLNADEDINTGVKPSKSFLVSWMHSQDAKASQYSSFRANVSYQSGNGYRNDVTASDEEFYNKNINSTVSYQYSIPNSPFNLSASAKLNQVIDPSGDEISTTNNLTLPQLTFNMKRVDIPLAFLKKNRLSSKKWFEKIGITYTLNSENRLKFNQQQLDTINLTPNNFEEYLQIKNGVKHTATMSTSFNMKSISVSPNIRTTGNWYFRHYDKYLDPVDLVEVTDTVKEFSQVWSVTGGVNLTGKIYGMYAFKGDGKVKAMRHQITASAGLNYSPGNTTNKFGYVGDDGDFVVYNPYNGSIYTPPSSNPTNIYNFKVINDLEAKVKTKNDTVNDFRKVKFINNLSIESSFDALSDSLRWSDIRMSGRFTKLFDVLNINYNAIFDAYGYDNSANKINDSYYSQTGKLLRVKSTTLSANFTLKSKKKTKKIKPKNEAEQAIQDEYEEDPSLWDNLNIPWDVNVSYNINLSRTPKSIDDSLYFDQNINHTLGVRGSFTIFKIFRFSVTTSYDFVNLEFAPSTIGLYVDLHCWELSASIRPNGSRKSYSFALNVKSPLLKDLKIKKENTYGGGSGFF